MGKFSELGSVQLTEPGQQTQPTSSEFSELGSVQPTRYYPLGDL